MKPLTFGQLQKEHKEWADRNFPNNKPHTPLLGLMEELGEMADVVLATSIVGRIAHSHLKAEQGIRGSKEQHAAKIKDAIGDMLVFLCNYCTRNDYDLQEIIEEVWAEVKQRDWNKNPLDADKKVG